MSPRKSFLMLCLAVLAIGVSPVAGADDGFSNWKPSGGFGVGMLHAGYGINLAIRNDRSLLFAAIGCGQSSVLYRCGDAFSVGYFRSGLFGAQHSRHTLGLYAGQFERTHKGSGDETRGLGIGYVYFPRGISGRGLSLGLGFEVGRTDGRTDHHEVQAQLGVQF